ncbi:MAG: protein translocase subunit SecF [Clostridia bacterium]|nr:protein translocase subunit SecF [Clostridia bacterium]
MKNWWNGNFDYLKSRKICWYISLGLLIVGILFNVIFGTSLDVTFRGGNELQYSYTGEVDINKLQSDLNAAGFKATVRKAESANTPVIKISIPGEALDATAKADLTKVLNTNFKDNKLTDAGSQSLSPTMGSLFLLKCAVALLIAAAFLLLYVGIRFRKIGGITAALCAVAALFHDMIIVYFAFVIFRIPLNDNFVAVLLAILGYSLNSTIVVFDRIRENRTLFGKTMSLPEIVNLSLNQSVRRNVSTTVTTVSAMAAVAIVAVAMSLDSVVSFAVPLLFGLLSGFYSSQFLCAPTWVLWAVKEEEAKALKAKTKKSAKKPVKKVKK